MATGSPKRPSWTTCWNRWGRHRPLTARLWFGQVDPSNTTIWAQFPGVDPNEAEVEINVRQTVFYPDKPGVNYITVRGLTMMHAATPWAPPTAEQIGLIGTHWSKGWIIENNDIRYSTCVGIALGKHGDQWDNTSQNTAEGYVKTIERAIENGWSKENIGHHIVRNNRISHCEQAGIVGSLGAVFSTITGNVIHDIHVRQLFTGAEMAGIKIHAAIDTEISQNHIYRTCRGIWLDWMAQGTRVTRNLLHDNQRPRGPFCRGQPRSVPGGQQSVSLADRFARYVARRGLRAQPVCGSHRAPSRVEPRDPVTTCRTAPKWRGCGTSKAATIGSSTISSWATPAWLPYDKAAQPMQMAGNVFLKGAQPSQHEVEPLVRTEFDPGDSTGRREGSRLPPYPARRDVDRRAAAAAGHHGTCSDGPRFRICPTNSPTARRTVSTPITSAREGTPPLSFRVPLV